MHLSLPSDLAVEAYLPAKETARRKSPVEEHIPPKLSDFADRITASRRPLILVGLGVEPAAGWAVRKFVDKLGAPFLVTPKAKGILPEDDTLALGVASGMAIDADIVETIRMADLTVGIGFDPVECDKTWFAEVDIISIDSASMAEGNYRPVEVIGDILTLLNRLTDSIESARAWPRDMIAARRLNARPTFHIIPGTEARIRMGKALAAMLAKPIRSNANGSERSEGRGFAAHDCSPVGNDRNTNLHWLTRLV